MQREGGCHAAVLHEVAQLPPHVIVGDVGAAGVGAQSHGDTLRQTRLGQRHNALEHHKAVGLLLVGGVGDAAVKQGVGHGGGDGGYLECAPLLEQPQDIRVRPGSVLNGVHAVFQRHADALGALHMGRHLHAQSVGLIAGGLHQRRLHPQHPGLTHHLGVHDAAGDHQLDEVGLLRRDLLHAGRSLLRRAGLVGQGACHVASGHGYRHVGRHHAGAQDGPCRRLIADNGVKIRHAAHRADGGDAAEQLHLGVALAQADAHAAHQAVGGDELHQLFGVGGLLFGLAGGRQVDMQVDEPGQHVLPAQIHRLVPRGRRSVGDGGDTAAVHADDLPLLGRHITGAVQQHAVYQRIAFFVLIHCLRPPESEILFLFRIHWPRIRTPE